MLQLPSTGTAPSVKKHNGRLDVQADWLEASVLFASEMVSRSDIVDVLLENNTYQDQDFANEWIDMLLAEIDRRIDLLGEAGAMERAGDRVRKARDWKERPAYAFCVALSVLPLYRQQVVDACGLDYTEQGELLERLSAEALQAQTWQVTSVGWSKAAANSIEAKVSELASALGEFSSEEAVKRWTNPKAKDAGLDLVACKPFPDGWGGRPVCLVQCASGQDWVDKLHTPNLRTWEKLIDFTTKPRRGLAMPFAPGEDDFRRRANSDGVMLLLDRHRLLVSARDGTNTFPSAELRKELIAWTELRSAAFPTDDE